MRLPGVRILGIIAMCAAVASCSTTKAPKPGKQPQRSKEYFSEKEYGVKASPRVVTSGPVPKGGGRFMVGDTYTVKGKQYTPKEEPGYNRKGLASWYGSAFHGRLTANGEVYDADHLSAAHPTFPLPSYARVTNLDNGSSVVVRVNDRGPFHPGRIIDVSSKTAEMLDMKRIGTANVQVSYVGLARMDGHDMPYLMASYRAKGDRSPSVNPEGQIASGVMVASAAPVPMSRREVSGIDYRADIQTGLSGTTPSGPVPVAASRGQAAIAATVQSQEFALLPDYGPVLNQRPGGNYLRAPLPAADYASAYPVQSKPGKSSGAVHDVAEASARSEPGRLVFTGKLPRSGR